MHYLYNGKNFHILYLSYFSLSRESEKLFLYNFVSIEKKIEIERENVRNVES